MTAGRSWCWPTTCRPEIGEAGVRRRGDLACDVAVVGGGITGLTVALLLAQEGMSVVLVEQHRVVGGTSGRTTAKVTSQHHLTYARLPQSRGLRGLTTYGAAMEASKEKVVPFGTTGALRFDDQVELHPVRYLLGLAEPPDPTR